MDCYDELSTADEIRANLPTQGAVLGTQMETELRRGMTLDIGLVIVGKQISTRLVVAREDLQGDCEDATHLVRAVTVGAFAMATGTRGQTRGVASVFGSGVSGASESTHAMFQRDGNPESCREAGPDDTQPPAQCGAPLRMRLRRIDEPVRSEVAAPEVPGCPAGFVWNDSGCVAPRVTETHQCREDDVAGCTEQCERGHAGSCVALASMYANGRGMRRNAARAVALFRSACDAGNALGCNNLGLMYKDGRGVGRNDARAVALFRRACNAGHAASCRDLGFMFGEGRGVRLSDTRSDALMQRACDGGDAQGCFVRGLGHIWGTAGVSEDRARGLDLMRRACLLADTSTSFCDFYRIWQEAR